MNDYIIKSLIGKYVCAKCRVKYCHVIKVLATEENVAIANLVINTRNDKIYHWFVEVCWETDKRGIHKIIDIKIIREDELNGYTEKDKII